MKSSATYALLGGLSVYIMMSDKPSEHKSPQGLDQRFLDDFEMYESYNIDYDYFEAHPFKGSRCVRSDVAWTYEDTFCNTKGDSFGLKADLNMFGLSRKQPKKLVYGLNCIHSNATTLTYLTKSKQSVNDKLAWVLDTIPDGVTTYQVTKSTKRTTGFSATMGSITEQLSKWKQALYARADNPDDYYKIGMEYAMYFHHNKTSFKTTCSHPHMKLNLICTYFNKCSAATTY